MRTTTKQPEIDCETSQSGWRSSQKISRIHRCQHARTILMTQIRNVLRKWQPRSTVFFSLHTDRNCEVHNRTKISRAPCRRRTGEAVPRAEKFGDLITADHNVLNEEDTSRNNHWHTVVVHDLATQWIQSYPCKTKTCQETEKSLRKFLEPSQKPKVIDTDNSLEFGKFCEDLS